MSEHEDMDNLTIGNIAASMSNKRNNQQRSPNSLTESPVGKLSKAERVDPILVIAGASPFDLSDRIALNNGIMSDSESELKFTMLDKNGNLLIFPKTKEDAKKIMLCESLLSARKKIDLSTNEKKKNDDRPKIVIFGLQYSEALKYFEDLKSQGVIELIDLAKKNSFNFSAPNIVKAVMDNAETADELVNFGEVFIGKSGFRVEHDAPKTKMNTTSNKNSLNHNYYTNQPQFNRNNQPATKDSNNANINSSNDDLLEKISKTFNDTIANLKIDLVKEIKGNVKSVVAKNNEQLANAITEVINMSRKLKTNEILKPDTTLKIVNSHCKFDNNETEY
jgi:hypothetical protein